MVVMIMNEVGAEAVGASEVAHHVQFQLVSELLFTIATLTISVIIIAT